MKIGAILIGLLFSISGYSQIQPPRTPQFPATKPIYGTSQQPDGQDATIYQQTGKVKIGANANAVQFSSFNNPSISSTLRQRNEELIELMRDIQLNKAQFSSMKSQRRVADTSHLSRFRKSLVELQSMLSGSIPMSVADAYYSIESAYGKPYLSEAEYKQVINRSVQFIKTWMRQNDMDGKDLSQVHYAIQQFMSETLTINKSISNGENGVRSEIVSHEPFYYDYKDYQGQKDYRNMFLTKCLATGMGQCNSMPLVYLVLAEGLGVPAYLSFAPHHSLVKFPKQNGRIANYEPTSGWEVSDKWYKDNLFINEDAVRSGIYLDTLNSKKVVANGLFDLAMEYMYVDLTGNDDFVLECLRAGVPYFPENNNIQSLFIYSMCLKNAMRNVMAEYNISSLEDINGNPEAKELYSEYMSTEAYITKLGYRDLPSDMYEQLLEEQEFKGKVQEKYSLSGKEKRNLFSNINN